MKAVVYARVSSREQEREGYSIPAQRKLCTEYARMRSLEVAEVFVDVESAKNPGRKEFSRMLQLLKSPTDTRVVIVEKTDRLYRNRIDSVKFEELIEGRDVEVHLVREGRVIGKNSRSQDKFMHDIHVAVAKNYVENLKDEVKKGMHEKAAQGIYPGRAPFGYVNNKAERSINVHNENARILIRIFELYATGHYSLASLRKTIRIESGKAFSKAYLHTMLTNRFYVGTFTWGGKQYAGTHPPLVSPELFAQVQEVFAGHHKPKYGKHDIAFRGMLNCAYDDCTVTAELKKGKYVYYRCSGYRGKCALPRFREEDLSSRLAEVVRNIKIPEEVVRQIGETLASEQQRMRLESASRRANLEQRLAAVRRRMDQAYTDKLDGKIPEEFWDRKSAEWRDEEQQLQMAIRGLSEASTSDRLLDVQRILELANKAHFLYVTQKPAEQAKMLQMILLNCSIDAVSVTPTYRKPFDMIFQRAKNEEWSGRGDLNS